MHLSVVIPSYNEERRVGRTLQTVLAYLAQQPYSAEVIVVDDGSNDATADIVTRLCETVVEAKDVTELKGDHYWLAYVDRTWKQKRTPREILTDNGYEVGQPIRAATSYQSPTSSRHLSLSLFPVWRSRSANNFTWRQ